MAVLSPGMTLADLAKQQEPNGAIAPIIEKLAPTNEILPDMVFKEGNLTTGHRTVVRSGLPEATLRMLNQHVGATKSSTAQITFDTATAVSWCEFDTQLLKMSANPEQFRANEIRAHTQGVMKAVAQNVIYGNSKLDPTQPMGLTQYYNQLGLENAENIIDAGGTGSDNASIWLVGWGDMTISGIVPRGMPAGLQITPYGEQVSQTTEGLMAVDRTMISQSFGIAVEDWRYAVRGCNIDRSSISSVNLPELMYKMTERLPEMNSVRPVFYMDRYVLENLRIQLASQRSSSTLTLEEVGGVRTNVFQGTPIRRVEALRADEARVVA